MRGYRRSPAPIRVESRHSLQAELPQERDCVASKGEDQPPDR
jgi:hypothetical protein